jgi:hypothetical protein
MADPKTIKRPSRSAPSAIRDFPILLLLKQGIWGIFRDDSRPELREGMDADDVDGFGTL